MNILNRKFWFIVLIILIIIIFVLLVAFILNKKCMNLSNEECRKTFYCMLISSLEPNCKGSECTAGFISKYQCSIRIPFVAKELMLR